MGEHWITKSDGPGVATLGVTICLGSVSLIVVILRGWARQKTGAIGWDDFLMMAGLAIFLACCVFTSMAINAGMGTADERLTDWNQWLVFFQITYAWSLPFIKTSICLTVFRITNRRRHRVILGGVMVASMLSTTVGFVAVVAVCRPVSYTWDKSIDEKCAPSTIITTISYVISVLAIITDWTCAIVPTVVVWGLQMKSRVKASVCAVLALVAVASAATIVRLPYLQYSNKPENYFRKLLAHFHHPNIANIVLWSIFECGIGIIAGSLPSLRRLLKFWLDKSSKGSYNNTGSNNLNPGSGYQGSNGVSLNNLSGRGMTVSNCQTAQRDIWVQLDDDDNSQKHIVMKTQEISVSVEDGVRLGHS
ncbi:cation-transporting atpase 4 [Colletotrichum plurivorum]|uniref:Cation-transporting atpase 4 n=1 Tax=Colletotrichum plurivorum TaxID=2175906 RepID=A0A8H6N4Y3_9PEZI|nr:cation-transporting atpase 4 [Colletotrichum plurivorum]